MHTEVFPFLPQMFPLSASLHPFPETALQMEYSFMKSQKVKNLQTNPKFSALRPTFPSTPPDQSFRYRPDQSVSSSLRIEHQCYQCCHYQLGSA